MNRFFVKSTGITGEKIVVDDRKQVHHIRNVLRLKVGEKAVVFDDCGNEYNCVICGLEDKVFFQIKSKILTSNKVSIELTIACAIPKKAKLDDIIDKLAQLNVHRVIPLKAERVVVKLDKNKESLRLKRWEAIALTASKQCQRNNLIIIEPIKSFKDLLPMTQEFDLKLIAYLGEKQQNLKGVLNNNSKFRKAIILIGPEGDFTNTEVDLALKSGFIPITLGDLVLRVDTAAIAVASFIRLYAYH